MGCCPKHSHWQFEHANRPMRRRHAAFALAVTYMQVSLAGPSNSHAHQHAASGLQQTASTLAVLCTKHRVPGLSDSQAHLVSP